MIECHGFSWTRRHPDRAEFVFGKGGQRKSAP
jgi:hypothetical protein